MPIGKIFKGITYIFSTMSVVLLIEYGFYQGWSAPARLLVEFWDNALNAVLVEWLPLEGLLEWTLLQVSHLFGWVVVPIIQPHWKHVFVLLMMIYGAFSVATFREGNRWFAAYAFSIGFLLALLSSITVGILSDESTQFLPNLLVSYVPALLFWLSIFLVWLPKGGIPNQKEKKDTRDFFVRSAVTLLILLLATWLLLNLAFVRDNGHIGLLCLAAFVIFVAVNRMYFGWREAREKQLPFKTHGTYQRGITILSGFVGALGFVILNAGLKLAGL